MTVVVLPSFSLLLMFGYQKKGLQPGLKRNASVCGRLCCACMVGLRCGQVLTRFVFSNRSPIGICIDDTTKRGLRVLTVFFYLTEAGHRATHLRVETLHDLIIATSGLELHQYSACIWLHAFTLAGHPRRLGGSGGEANIQPR